MNAEIKPWCPKVNMRYRQTEIYHEAVFGFAQLRRNPQSVTVNFVKCVQPTVAYQQLLWSDGVICVDAKLLCS